MFIGLETVEDGRNSALGVDHERGPINPHIFLAVHALFLEHVVLLDHGLVFIGQQ